MKEFRIEPNLRVNIRVKSAQNKDQLYSSRVEDLNEETISLAAPISIGAVVLAPGREI